MGQGCDTGAEAEEGNSGSCRARWSWGDSAGRVQGSLRPAGAKPRTASNCDRCLQRCGHPLEAAGDHGAWGWVSTVLGSELSC